MKAIKVFEKLDFERNLDPIRGLGIGSQEKNLWAEKIHDLLKDKYPFEGWDGSYEPGEDGGVVEFEDPETFFLTAIQPGNKHIGCAGQTEMEEDIFEIVPEGEVDWGSIESMAEAAIQITEEALMQI